MSRNLLFLLLSAWMLPSAASERGTLDPAFKTVPFDQWLAEHDHPHFHWSASVSRPVLSFHQRLLARIEVSLDGKDLDTRRNHGRIVFLIQVTDKDGTRYQQHSSIELDKLDPDVRNAMLESSHTAFFTPGDYELAAAVFDTQTGEHSTTQSSFRIAGPRDPFFVAAWRDLPPVEFLQDTESPDSWYLPNLKGHLKWADSLQTPARLNVILNVAPSAGIPGSRTPPSSGMAALLPTLKAITETGSSSVTEHVELLDLARRIDVFHQNDVQDLDWPRLKLALGSANTASIDVHTLAERHHDAQYFVSQVRRLIRTYNESSVLVVLTTAVAFESGEDLEPISTESLPPTRVIYVRYHAPLERQLTPFPDRMGGRGARMGGSRMSGGGIGQGELAREIDQLAATLKPLSPEIFDVEKPAQVTRIFSEIEKDLRKEQ